MTLDKGNVLAKLGSIRALEGVRAIAPSRAPDVIASATALTAQHLINSGDARAFEAAGWHFIKDDKPSTSKAGLDVVVDSDGRLKILAHALNVKFRPSVPRNMVENVLGRFGLSMRRNMGFSPNLFLVDDPGGDTLSTARSLNKLDDVVYAEPVLIEPIESR